MKTSIKRVLAFLMAFTFIFGEMPISTLAATPNKVRITVVYEMPDGCATPAPASKKLEGAPGEAYVASSPKVEGFKAEKDAVYGNFGKTNETITVKYSPIYYVAKVQYVVPAGYESKKPRNKHKTGSPGTKYDFETPTIDGLIPDQKGVSGEIKNQDETFTVTYYADEYTVLVNYEVPAGFTAPASGRAVGIPGAAYSVKSPELKGLTPDQDEVKGNIGKADETKTVTYTKDSHSITVHFEVPAGYEAQKPKDVTKTEPIGTEVTIPVPKIEGLSTATKEVVGNIGYEDEEITVRYTDKLYTVVVQYRVPDGYQDKTPKQQSKTGLADEDFTFPVPKIDGLRADYPETDQTVKIGNGSSLGDYRIILVTYKEATYKVRVNYVTPVGYDMDGRPDYQEKSGLKPGETYSIRTPDVTGLYVSEEDQYVTGEIGSEDVEKTVYYKESDHWAWVDYVVPEGYEDQRPERQTGTGKVDEEFSFKSPTIAGLKPDQDEVTGKFKKTDQDFTVTYEEVGCPEGGEHEYAERNLQGENELFDKEYDEDGDLISWHYWRELYCKKCNRVFLRLNKEEGNGPDAHKEWQVDVPYPGGKAIDYGLWCYKADWKCPVCGADRSYGHYNTDAIAGETDITFNGSDYHYTAPNSGVAENGQTFSAGDRIWMCKQCQKVYSVLNYASGNEPTPFTTCTVHYEIPDGYSRSSFWTQRIRRVGTEITIDSPQIAGLAPDHDSITHTFTEEDAEYTVTYSPIPVYSVTVDYEVPEGFTAPESKTLEGLTDKELYAVRSPIIDGLRPDISMVSGRIAGQNVTQTVSYTPSKRIDVHLRFPADYTGAKDMDWIYYYQPGEHYNVSHYATYKDLDYFVKDAIPLEGTMPDANLDITVEYYYNTSVLVGHKLTIHYLWPSGRKILEDYTMEYAEGARYEVKSPDSYHMQPNIETVSGTMGRADVEVNVTYTDTHCEVWLTYVAPAGYNKPKDTIQQVKIGDEFAFKSPTIDGLVCNKPVVKGKMGHDIQKFTIKYEFPTYQRAPYKLTVNYTVPTEFAGQKPATWTGNFYEGTTYKAPIPVLENLTPSVDKLEGSMPDHDLTLEVSYRPTDSAYYYVIVHFDIPEGYQQIEDFKVTGMPGTPYHIVAPHIPGLTITEKSDILSGKFTNEDQEFTFHYKKLCTIYIRFDTEEGKRNWPQQSSYYNNVAEGTHIHVESPKVPGWVPENPDYEVFDFDATEDVDIDVNYVLAPTVTVNYVYDGPKSYAYMFRQPETHIESVRPGGSYHVDSPPVENMKPDKAYVEGNDVQANVTHEVKYTLAGKVHNVYVYMDLPTGRRECIAIKPYLEEDTYHIDPGYHDSSLFTVEPSYFEGTMGTEDIDVVFDLHVKEDQTFYNVQEGDDQTVTETERDDGTPEVNKSAQFKIGADPEKVLKVTDGKGNELREGRDYTVKGSSAVQKQNAVYAAGSGESLALTIDQNGEEAADGTLAMGGEQVERLAADGDGNTTVIELTASYLDSLGPGDHMLLVNFTNGAAMMSFTIEASEKWNLFEDGSAHDFTVKGISASEETVNTNKTSAKFFDATLSGDTISVSLKAGADRKKAANANTFDFDLGKEGTVSYVLPLTYNKPVLKLTSTKGTVRKGTEATLTTTVLYQTQNGNYASYDLTGATVTYAGQSVTTGDDGLVSIKADGKKSGKIAITKDGWNAKDPVTLNYSVAEVKADKDVLALDMGGLKQVTLNTNAPEQSFTFPLSFNGAPATADTVTIEKGKKGEEALGSISDGTLSVSLGRSGIKKGSYTLKLKSGKAALSVKVKVSDKALNKAASGKVTQKYDVVTGKPMVIVPTLKEVQGSISAVRVSSVTLKKGTAPLASDFTAKVNNGNIEVAYSGSALTAKNLKIGDMTFELTVTDYDGNKISVPLTVKNVSAKKTTPTVKAAKVVIPKASAEKADGTTVIGSANIISTYKDSAKHVQTIQPTDVTLSCKNVEAKPSGNSGRILITKLNGKSGTIKATLTYPGGVTKTVTIKVSKGK